MTGYVCVFRESGGVVPRVRGGMIGHGGSDRGERLLPRLDGTCGSSCGALSWAVSVRRGVRVKFLGSWQGSALAVAIVPWLCCGRVAIVHACVR